VCVAAFVVVRVAGRLLATGRRRGPQLLDVVARLPLEPRRSLYVVEVAGKTLLVGTSEMGLSVLSELDGAQVRGRLAERPSFGELVRAAWQRRHGWGAAVSGEPRAEERDERRAEVRDEQRAEVRDERRAEVRAEVGDRPAGTGEPSAARGRGSEACRASRPGFAGGRMHRTARRVPAGTVKRLLSSQARLRSRARRLRLERAAAGEADAPST